MMREQRGIGSVGIVGIAAIVELGRIDEVVDRHESDSTATTR